MFRLNLIELLIVEVMIGVVLAIIFGSQGA